MDKSILSEYADMKEEIKRPAAQDYRGSEKDRQIKQTYCG